MTQRAIVPTLRPRPATIWPFPRRRAAVSSWVSAQGTNPMLHPGPLRFLIVALVLFAFAASAAQADEAGSTWREQPQWHTRFSRAGVHGTMLVYDEGGRRWLVSDTVRARHAYTPASTFKLFNALVALDTGAVHDEFDPIRWDGQVRTLGGAPAIEWNRDNTLASGMRYSTVWFYQEVARRAGQERMQSWIDKAGYGNRDIGGGIDRFWLAGNLRISAEQQIAFLRALADDKLPFSKRAQEVVRRISIVESQPTYVLHAKAGFSSDAGKEENHVGIGWYVGWVEHAGRRWFFALNADMPTYQDAPKRMSLAKSMLEDIGALPADETP